MPKFFTGNELNSELEKIFENAEEQIILISPYIKLHERYISTLKTKLTKHKLKITIVFGKNEDDLSRSMKQEDFNFFKEFPNIEIRYEKRLHAKYYASEKSAILSSMNLYNYSQDNNIEAGVLTKHTVIGNIASNLMTTEDSFDYQTSAYFKRVIDQSELLFQRKPYYETILIIGKKYNDSKTEVDKLTEFFNGKVEVSNYKSNNERKSVEKSTDLDTAFCIRTGISIPFNTERPMTNEAFKSWSRYGDENYPEKFCHFSGESSHGETSFTRPILFKNWKKAKEKFGF